MRACLNAALVCLAAGFVAVPARAQPGTAEEKLLKAARLPTDGAELVEYFRKITTGTLDHKGIAALINRLGAEDFQAREKATRDLIALDYPALPALRTARKDPDPEVQKRAARCIQAILNGDAATKLAAAARLIAWRRPAGAAPVLLAFYPYAENPKLTQAVFTAAWSLDGGDAREALPELLKALRVDERKVRLRALQAIAYLGPEAAPAVPAVSEFLKDLDKEIRQRALATLEVTGPAAKEALPRLLPLLKDEDVEIRSRATALVGRLGPNGKKAIADLLERLLDPNNKQSLQAARALADIGPDGIPALLHALAQGRPHARSMAAMGLGNCGPGHADVLARMVAAVEDGTNIYTEVYLYRFGAEAAGPLAKHLAHKEADVRARVARALAYFGPLGQAAAPALRQRLKDDYLTVRRCAAQALWHCERRADDVAGVLIEAFRKEPEPPRRWEIFDDILIHLEPRPAEVVTLVLEALQDPNASIRTSAARALAFEPTRTQDVSAALVQALQDRDSWVRGSAAHALGWQGPATPAVVPALAKMLGDSNSQAKQAAVQALYQIGKPAKTEVPALIEALQVLVLRDKAAQTLGKIGPEAKAAVPALIKVATPAAVRALGDIGPEARQAIPFLIKNLKNTYQRTETLQALARMGPEAIDPLIEALNDRDAQISQQSGYALAGLGPVAVPALRKYLESKAERGRLWAAMALGMIGTEAEGAVEALIAATRDADPGLRRMAVTALGKIGPAAKVVPTLTAMLSDPETRFNALSGLKEFGPKARAAVGALEKQTLEKGYASLNAADALSHIDPKNKVILPALHRALQEGPAARRGALKIAHALRYDDMEILAALEQAILAADPFPVNQAELQKHLESVLRYEPVALKLALRVLEKADGQPSLLVLNALRKSGGEARPAVPRLIALLRNRNLEVQKAAARVLAAIGVEARAALPALLDRVQERQPNLRTPDFAEAFLRLGGSPHLVVNQLAQVIVGDRSTPDDRDRAIALLAELGPRAKSALPDLLHMANSLGKTNTGHFRIRPYAAHALWKVGGLTDEAVQCLIMAVKAGYDADSQLKAIGSLGEIGPHAKAAVPALRMAARSSAPPVRQAADEALRRIVGKKE